MKLLEELLVKPLGGILRIVAGEELMHLPSALAVKDGQVVLSVVVDCDSPLYPTFNPGMAISEGNGFLQTLQLGETALFESRLGPISLVQMGKPVALSHNLGMPVEVEFRPRLAFLGDVLGRKWRHPAAVQIEIAGLADWMHDSFVTRSVFTERGEQNDDQSEILIRMRDYNRKLFELQQSDLLLAVESELEPEHERETDVVALKFHSTVSLALPSKTTWYEALENLRSFQELIQLLSWKPVKGHRLRAKITKSERESDGEIPHWMQVLSREFPFHRPVSAMGDHLDFILPFKSLTGEMIDRWYLIRDRHSAAMRHFLSVLQTTEMSPEVRSLQLGAGFEILGSQLSQTDNLVEDGFKGAVRYFLRVGSHARFLFPDQFDGWAIDANKNYQSMKHLNRSRPTIGALARNNDLSTLAFQIWLARELGVEDDEIIRYARSTSRLGSEYVKLPDPSSL